MRKVALESTFYFCFSTRQFSTGASFALAGTPDLAVIENESGTPIDTGATCATGHASVTGLNLATVIATAANGYEAGKTYQVYIDAGTVDTVSVVGSVVYEFQIESVAERASRLALEALYPTGVEITATTTGNTTGRINLTDVLDAQTADASLVGAEFVVWDATNSQVECVVIVSVQSARLFNVACISDGAVMDFTVAVGDYVIQTGRFNALRATVPGRTVGVSATGDADADVNKINGTAVSGAGTSADKWRA